MPKEPRPKPEKFTVVGHCAKCGMPIYGSKEIDRKQEVVYTRPTCLCCLQKDIQSTMRTS